MNNNTMGKACFIIATVLAFSLSNSDAQHSNRIRIAAASNLKFALDSIVIAFKAGRPGRVDVSYGSSGKLFEQLSNGAPFDIFFSADMNFPALLRKKDLAASEVYVYGVGRIVLWSNKFDPREKGMRCLLQPGVRKIAIANPMHAPYGKRAEEALAYYEIFEIVREKLVYGQNISQTAQFVTSGAADAGIIALSLALSPNMKKENGSYYLIPEVGYEPLEQGAVVTRHGKGNAYARTFMTFVQDDVAGAIFDHFGFTRP